MRDYFNKACKNQKQVLVVTFFLVFVTLILAFAGFQQNNINNMRRIMIAQEKISVEAQTHILKEEFGYVKDSLNFLYKAPTFRNYINGENTKSNVEKEWAVFVSSMKKYDKLRYIDAKGNEIIGINYHDNQAQIMDAAFLQNKKNQDYFTEAMANKENKIYVSKFDLSSENNMVSAPVKSPIRVALPVFDQENNKRGIIIIDYLVDAAIYAEGSNTSFISKFPTEWARIKIGQNGYFFTSNGLFTFQKINLGGDIVPSSANLENDANAEASGLKASFIISRIPASAEPYAKGQNSFLLSLEHIFYTPLLLLMFIFSSCFFAILVALYKEKMQKTNIALSYDKLTGCYNRVFGTNIIEKEIKRADRYQRPLSLIMLDLDHFKQVNDKYGHPIGDVVLKTVASIAGGLVRKSDSLIRLGGEEFLILLPETKVESAYQIAEKIRIALANYVHPLVGKVTVSFGVGEKLDSEVFRHWYERVDAALYRAKSSGRNKVVVSSDQDQLIFVSKQLEWKSEWESGNKKIDEQHFSLLQTGNNLVRLSLSGVKDEEIIQILESLLEDISKHFTDEEQVLDNINYLEYEEHAHIHKDLYLKALSLKNAYQAGEIKPSALISFIVSDVVRGHILHEDIKYFPFLKAVNK